MGAAARALAFCVAVAVVTGAASGPPGMEQRVVRRAAGKEAPDGYRRGASGPRNGPLGGCGAPDLSGPEDAPWAGPAEPVPRFLPPSLPGDLGQSWRGSWWGFGSLRATTQVRGRGWELDATSASAATAPHGAPVGCSLTPGSIGRARGCVSTIPIVVLRVLTDGKFLLLVLQPQPTSVPVHGLGPK